MRTTDLLGKTNSLLGFGCMRFPTLPDGRIDREKTFAMLDGAYERGVTYYDTAYPYHNQESETVLGLWQKTKPRDSLCIATKLPIWLVQSAGEARAVFEEQLNRLQTDHIDYYLFHGLNAGRWDKIQDLGLLPLLEEWKSQGKIGRAGFSFHDGYFVFEKIIRGYPWDFCQLQLNYMDTETQAGLRGYTLAKSMGIPVIVMEPVKGGRLTVLPEQAEKRFREARPDWSNAAWALRWAASKSNVAVVLSGMSTLEQVLDNVNTFTSPELTPQERDVVKLAAWEIEALQKVPCTACRYCMPCPAGVEIPDVFSLWNDAAMFHNSEKSRRSYQGYEETQKASACVECGRCMELCPQQIKIPNLLKEAHMALTDPKQ